MREWPAWVGKCAGCPATASLTAETPPRRLQHPWLSVVWQWTSFFAVLGFLAGSELLALRLFRSEQDG